jgi:pimeloyl-ACP methyl ester carboxylesterase
MNADADLSTRAIADLIAELLDRLELEDVTLVGSDTGGALCQLLAADHPERIGRLVLTNCDMFENFPPKLFRPLLASAKVPGALALIAASFRVRPLTRLPLAYGWLAKTRIDDDALDAWIEPCRRPEIRRDLKKVLAGIDPRETIRAAEQLRSFDRPVLLAWAEDDRFFTLEQARRFVAQVPAARLETIPDSYTFTMEDQPEKLATLIANFVRQPAATAS